MWYAHLARSCALTVITLTALLPYTPTQANQDLSRLAFHPVPLDHQSPALAPIPITTADPPRPAEDTILHEQAGTEARDGAAYAAEIAAVMAQEGPYALPLSELSHAHGQWLQQAGDPEAALEAFQRSMHVLRVNLGPYSPEQIPVMRAIVNAHLALGNLDAANDIEEALFNLRYRHEGTGSSGAASALIEWADWNMNFYLLAPQSSAFLTGDPGSATREPRLDRAYRAYADAVVALQQQGHLDDDRLYTTERKLATLSFISNQRLQRAYGTPHHFFSVFANERDLEQAKALERANTTYFLAGRSALQRALAYSYDAPEPEYDHIAKLMMELGDWYLLFDQRSNALDIYADAQELLQATQLSEADVARIMTPGMPVRTPIAAYLEQEAPDAFAGFIDVEFELSRFGKAHNPQVITSNNADQDIERELLRTIRNCRFRPMIVAGNAVKAEKMQLRYYYSL